jgi:hypothetical protein
LDVLCAYRQYWAQLWSCTKHTLDFRVVTLGFSHEERGCFAVQRVGRIWVAEELGNEHLEDVDHIVHGRPGLVDDIETDRAGPALRSANVSRFCCVDLVYRERGPCSQFIDVWVEDAVYEANAGALVGVLVG